MTTQSDKRDATVAALLRGMASALEGDIAGGRKVDPAGMLLVIRKIQSFTPSHALENAEPGCPHGMQTGGIPKAPCALCEADRLAASVPSTTPQKAGELLTREHDKSLRGAAARLALATGFQFDDCALDIQQVCNHVLAEHYAPSTTPRKLPFSLPAYVGDEYQGMHTVFAADHAIVAECYHSGIAEMIVKFFNGASAASAIACIPLQLRPPPELGEIVDRMGNQKSKDWSAHDIRVLLGFAAIHAGHAMVNAGGDT